MGMILNRFDMLETVRNTLHDKNGYYYDKIKNVQLTAVLVHNPHDKEFRDWVQKNFLNMARMTGERFLFLTFIPPSMEYSNGIGKDGYDLDIQKLYGDNSLEPESEEVSIELLRLHFDIKATGSFIVLTRNLEGMTIDVIQTNASSILSQFLDITNFCANTTNVINGPDYQDLINKLHAITISLEDDLITVLTDVASLMSQRHNSFLTSDGQLSHLKSALRKLKLKIMVLESNDEDKYEKLNTLIPILYDSIISIYHESKGYPPFAPFPFGYHEIKD